ncbi:MAG TPA: UPF0149 family protein [Pseudomonadales bacterium]|nr:UPF0149 family protein [Pseudomonadales bacterium]
MATITHEQLSARLQELQVAAAADALHGAITGLACAGVTPDHSSWLEQLAECLSVTELDDHRDAMAALHALVARDLGDAELGFRLMLPDEEEFLSVRAQALARWSENFVCGFVAVQRELTDEDRDVLADIAAISQIDDDEAAEQSALNNPENAHSNELDFMALCEYVRLAAIEFYAAGAAGKAGAVA